MSGHQIWFLWWMTGLCTNCNYYVCACLCTCVHITCMKSRCFSGRICDWVLEYKLWHNYNLPDLVDLVARHAILKKSNVKVLITYGLPFLAIGLSKSGGFHREIRRISPRYHLWNPPKIIKASVSAKTLQFDECRVGAMTKDFTHEIQWISPRYHLWNPPKIIKASVSAKTLQFDECRVGAMTKDFTHEIQWISPRFHLWNPPKIIKASVSAKTLQFDECRVGAMTKDFMKSTRFHPEIWWISPVKSGRCHPDFTCEIHPKL